MSRSLLAHTLDDAFAFASAIMTVDALAKEGRQSDALALVSDLARIAESKLPIIRAVITAQRQAAEAHDLAQRMPKPRVVCAAIAGVAPPQSDPANPQPQAPSEPGPIIA